MDMENPGVAAPAARRAGIVFTGKINPMVALLVRGWLLSLVTLGIYRFWLISDSRRYLWTHTEIDGDVLEYTGRGRELLIGFLIALAVTTPLYVGVALLSLAGPVAEGLAGLVFVLAFICLTQYAIYRARRYRLTRTIYRGIRLGLGGSAVRYMLLSLLWALIAVLSLGWAYPWRVAALENYAISHTYFGDKQAHFTATGAGFFAKVLPLQLVVAAPFMLALAYALTTLDTTAAVETTGTWLDSLEGQGGTAAPRDAGNPFDTAALGWLGGAFAWMVVSAIFLYPVYRAIEYRWWIGGIGLGAMTFSSSLTGGRVYKLYLKLLLATMIFGIVLSMAVGLLLGVVVGAAGDLESLDWRGLFDGSDIVVTGLVIAGLAVAYAIPLIGYYIIYQVIVWMGFWQVAAESVSMDNVQVLGSVRAAQEESSALGEGIADALDFGGF